MGPRLWDPHPCILHHQIALGRDKFVDDRGFIARGLGAVSVANFEQYEYGDSSVPHREVLEKSLELLITPKKGRINQPNKARGSAPDFVDAVSD